MLLSVRVFRQISCGFGDSGAGLQIRRQKSGALVEVGSGSMCSQQGCPGAEPAGKAPCCPHYYTSTSCNRCHQTQSGSFMAVLHFERGQGSGM